MAYTAAENKAIADFVAANINDPAAIAAKANELGVSAQAIAAATGYTPSQVNAYFSDANLSVPQITQDEVNALAREAAAQAGGTISYTDAAKAAATYGITPDQVISALSTGVITGGPKDTVSNIISDDYVSTSEAVDLVNLMNSSGLTNAEIAKQAGVDVGVIDQIKGYYDKTLSDFVGGFTKSYEGTDADAFSKSVGGLIALTNAGVSPADIAAASGGKFTEADVNNYVTGVTGFGDKYNQLAQSKTATLDDLTALIGSIDERSLRAAYGNDQIDSILNAYNAAKTAATQTAANQTTTASALPEGTVWDYNAYQKNLKTGDIDYSTMLGTLGAQSPVMAQNAQNVYKEILAQQQAGTAEYWYQGDTASKEAAAADFALRLAENGIGSLAELGQTTSTDVEGNPTTQYVNKATGEALPRQDLLGRGLSALDIDYQVAFNDQGQAIPYTTNRTSGWVEFRDAVKPIAAMVAGSLLAPGLGSFLGSATGLTGASLNALTGATLGAGGAALTGNDILKGAALGGLGGYVSGGGLSDLTGSTNSIYSLANGTPNLDYMGGGQGLTSTTAGNLSSMGGAQGLTILGGIPSTTLAEALSSFGGVNPSILSDMGIGQGITYVTPSGIVTENGTIIGGDTISQFGANTGFDLQGWLDQNVGAGIGDELAAVDTGVNSGYTGLGSTGLNLTDKIKDVTLSDIGNVARLGLLTTTLTGGINTDTGTTGFEIVPVPEDWTTPTYGNTTTGKALTPINFGSPEMLRGTQWEKYLGTLPDYTPTIAQAPITMGYPQLVSALQGGGGANLTIGDIISGIQGQYGQTPTSAVG